MQLIAKRRTRERRISKNKTDEVCGIFKDKCIRFGRLPLKLDGPYHPGGGKRQLSVNDQREERGCRLSISVAK